MQQSKASVRLDRAVGSEWTNGHQRLLAVNRKLHKCLPRSPITSTGCPPIRFFGSQLRSPRVNVTCLCCKQCQSTTLRSVTRVVGLNDRVRHIAQQRVGCCTMNLGRADYIDLSALYCCAVDCWRHNCAYFWICPLRANVTGCDHHRRDISVTQETYPP